MPYPPTLGVVLAGGLARRMGGGDKALRMLAGRTLIARVAARLAPQCDALVINANGDPARFSVIELPVIQDTVADFPGPLAGILAALEWCVSHRPEIRFVVSVATDTPFLPRDFVARLHQEREAAKVPLACAASGGRGHPAHGLWDVSLRGDLHRALVSEAVRRIELFTARYGVATAAWSAEPVDPFFNVNMPDDIAEAERVLAACGDR